MKSSTLLVQPSEGQRTVNYRSVFEILGRILLIAAAFVLPPFSAPVQAAGSLVSLPGFSLVVPEGWNQLPQEAIEKLNQTIVGSNRAQTQPYAFAFQRGSADLWFTHPYLLIQLQTGGRASAADLEKMKRMDPLRNEVGETVKRKFKSISSELRLGQSIYDSAAHIIWTTAETAVNNKAVRSISATVLTANGAIILHGYALSDFEAFGKQFEEIARSVTLDPQLRY